MKKILKVFISTGLLALTLFSCVKPKDFATAPGLAVYKTKGNYFNKAFVFMNSSGIYMIPSYYNPRYNLIDSFIKITNNDTVYTQRAKLVHGYILATEWSKDMVFLNLTFAEFLKYQIEHNTGSIPVKILKEHILDADPFMELYYDPNRPRKYELSDSGEINRMIKNGELGKYFKRLK